jgi:hypothetical protein
MTVLHLMRDGALAAAELLVLLFTASGPAPEQPATASRSIEQSVQLHRSAARDMRLLGAVAEVRSVPRLRDEGDPIGNRELPAHRRDREADAALVVSWSLTTEPDGAVLAAADCDLDPQAGHVRLTEDEAVAAAMWTAPRVEHVIRAIGRADTVDGALPTAWLVGQGDQAFLMVAPNVAATSAILALRPSAGSDAMFSLGAVERGTTILVPLANRQQLVELAEGAIEIELRVDGTTLWTTVSAGRADAARLPATAE